MKKVMLVLVAVAMLFALAPTNAHALVGVGLKATLNMADVSGDYDDSSTKTAGSFGVFAEVGMGPLSLQPEILYSMRGATVETVTENLQSEEVTLDLNYISIPILLKYNIIPAGPAKPYLMIGPELNFLSSADLDGTDVKDSFKNADYSLIIGAGVSLPMGLHVDARYTMGLSNIADMEINGEEFESKNRVIMIGVGYQMFGI